MKVDALILPEVIIARVLTAIVKMIRDDIALATPQEVRNTILFQLLGENEDGQPIHMNAYNYFRQAVKIFSNPANLEVHLGYNAQVTTALAVHIICPANKPLTPLWVKDRSGMLRPTSSCTRSGWMRSIKFSSRRITPPRP